MVKNALGKSLADINKEMGQIPDISVLTGLERVVVKPIPLVQISPNPNQPRKQFSEKELQELSDSIKEQGVLNPIILRSVQNKPYLYEIVAGERRYRASKMAGLSEIPALVKNITNQNAMELALIENVQRENLNPIEEAEGYDNLMKQCDYTIDDVSRLISKSESHIRNLLRINDLPESVKEMVRNGELSASHARTIAVSKDPEKLAHEIIANKLSVADTQSKVKTTERKKTSRTFNQKTMDAEYVAKIEKRLAKILKTDVKIREKKGGAGELILRFANRMQMEELINQISQN